MAEHGIAKAVEFSLRLRLRRLDHQGSGNRPAHGWRMEAAIDEPLGDVVDRHSGAFVERPRIDDALVRDAPMPACVEHVVGAGEALRDVIGAEDRDARRLGEIQRRPS